MSGASIAMGDAVAFSPRLASSPHVSSIGDDGSTISSHDLHRVLYGDGLSLYQRGLGHLSGVCLLKEVYKRYEVKIREESQDAGGSDESQQTSDLIAQITPWFSANGARTIVKCHFVVVMIINMLCLMKPHVSSCVDA